MVHLKYLCVIILLFQAFVAIAIARAANIYPLTFLLNIGRSQKIFLKVSIISIQKCILYLCMPFIVHVCKRYKSTKKLWMWIIIRHGRRLIASVKEKYYIQYYYSTLLEASISDKPYSTRAMPQKSKFAPQKIGIHSCLGAGYMQFDMLWEASALVFVA